MHPDWQNSLHVYSENFSEPEPQYLKELTHYTWRKTVNPRQLSGHLQGRFLAQLVLLKNPSCIWEIGTFTGYATACLAENLNAHSQIHAFEADAEIAFKAQEFWKSYEFMNKVQWHVGEALTLIPLCNHKPDFVFVDADKKNYSTYLDAIFPLLPCGGIMLFDNTLWSGKVIDETELKNDNDTQIMHAFNEKASKYAGAKTLLLPIRDGLTLLQKID
jgi:predicted O-methyltransferase YrrM